MRARAEVAAVGGGILGLAHSWVFAPAGKQVILFERRQRACGASVRNFGMIWPIGQPAGRMHATSLRSHESWLEALNAARISYRPTGSLHVGRRAEKLVADAAIICTGDDFETLYPEILAQSGLTRCKLQMMRTEPQPGNWQLGPALAAGLKLRFDNEISGRGAAGERP
jgi:glycine/D-amino acid oxidase-like deaminating enzyme